MRTTACAPGWRPPKLRTLPSGSVTSIRPSPSPASILSSKAWKPPANSRATTPPPVAKPRSAETRWRPRGCWFMAALGGAFEQARQGRERVRIDRPRRPCYSPRIEWGDRHVESQTNDPDAGADRALPRGLVAIPRAPSGNVCRHEPRCATSHRPDHGGCDGRDPRPLAFPLPAGAKQRPQGGRKEGRLSRISAVAAAVTRVDLARGEPGG